MPNQRPFFLSSFLSAFRQQTPSLQAAQQAAKHSTQTTSTAPSSSTPQTPPSSYTHQHQAASTSRAISAAASPTSHPAQSASGRSPTAGAACGVPIPHQSAARRRGSDSSTEGFRDALNADKWYIGGRTAGGEERFFKLGVVHRVRSNDGLSLDRLSL
ncbi:hypothetical protein CDD81_4622 [Ophiocordyceps australis]|uniref:Uncharacterized protein n=1 Tax=Ophiocordyceps australis TaxID=1399860 RepID=A0A2C5YBZ9_9HYPO|nr:hypothetical protein CDD81_4622 [Ophiocordyceps australis]